MRPITLDDWLRYQEQLHPKGIELGLDRVIAVRDRLGLTTHFPIITVGGTNGKGSTCAMLESVLCAASYKIGCYTSPHLVDYNERVRIKQRPVDDAALCTAFDAVETARSGIALTYFEFGTLAAMWLFCRESLDAVILEVGLGGRLDAVNAFDADCAIIASVDLDHQDFLGNTIETIGFEKAGIFRTGRPAIFSDPRVPQSVIDRAERVGAQFQLAGRDFGYQRMEQQWRYWGPGGKRHALPFPALRGAYQLNNAAGALAALEAMHDRLPVTLQDIKRGLLEVDLPGRLQVLPGRPAIVLDVAHNPHAALVLAEGLGSMGFHQNTHAVFSMLSDKDIPGVVEAVKHRFDSWHLAPIAHPRGASVETLKKIVTAAAPDKPLFAYSTIVSAYEHACECAAQNDRVVVFGSFYTVSEVLRVTRTGARRPHGTNEGLSHMVRPISDQELQMRVRARRRILGAVAVAVAMVVLLPMVLDSQPKREIREMAINIPAQDKAPPFNPTLRPVEPAGKTPAPIADVKPPAVSQSASDAAKPAPMESKPLEKPAADKSKPVDQRKAGENVKSAEATKAPESKAGKFAIQLGVFSNPDNASQVEARLKENKIRHYTETLKSPPGAIRVRAGPYPSRAEAESALTQMKLAGISGGVVVSE
jgi:dihydrofolate synthase/folylpolyglutamate synthase